MAAGVERIAGRACVLRGDDIDTDRIIPARFLRCVTFDGIGEHAFEDDREQAKGDHPLDDPRFRGASILVVGRNFGCGSSREHAPWALVDYGFRAVVSTSIADIFRNNSLKNGLLPVVVPADVHRRLLEAPGVTVTVSLEDQSITLDDGTRVTFPIPPFARYCLMHGQDELDFLLGQDAEITRFETARG
jgi:3-isopropylmalate/(R)-2-methylmalate dehydratase small subunit